MPEVAQLIALLALCAAWLGVRHLQHEATKPKPKLPCSAEALLSALASETGRLRDAAERLEKAGNCAVRQAAQATRRQPEPLPGTQRKNPNTNPTPTYARPAAPPKPPRQEERPKRRR